MKNMRKTITRQRLLQRRRDHLDSLSGWMDAIPFGLHHYQLRPDGGLIFRGGNPAADRILGIDHQSLIGKTIEEAFPHLAHTHIPDAYRKVAKNGGIFERASVNYQDKNIEAAFKIQAFQTSPACMAVLFQDIREKKQAEQALAESEERYRALVELSPEAIVIHSEGKLVYINPAGVRQMGVGRPEQILGTPIMDLLPPEAVQMNLEIMDQVAHGKSLPPLEQTILQPDGRTVEVEIIGAPVLFQGKPAFQLIIRNITEKKKVMEGLRESEEKFRTLIEQNSEGVVLLDEQGIIIEWNRAQAQITGISRQEAIGAPFWDIQYRLLLPERKTQERKEAAKKGFLDFLKAGQTAGYSHPMEITIQRSDGERVFIQQTIFPIKSNFGYRLGTITHDVSKSKRYEEKLQQTTHWLEEAERVARVGGWALDLNSGQVWVSPEAYKIYGLAEKELTIAMIQKIPLPECRPGLDRALQGLIEGTGDYDIEFCVRRQVDGAIRDIRSMAEYNPQTRRVFGAIQDITERKQAESQIQRQLEQLSALRAIDQSILSRLGLENTLDVLLEKITGVLQVDAANFLLYQPNTQTLIATAERGLPAFLIWDASLALKDTHAGRAALNLKIDFISDLSKIDDNLIKKIREIGENFSSYAAVPLVAKGELKGILEIFAHAQLEASAEWMGFLEALADQAAIAINSAQLFDEQQQNHTRLTKAYEDTIDGWSRALDLRDEETEGHSQRVTDLTMELARRMDIPEEELVHIRRGAKLHDIGKMGIPDSILLKPDVLTEAEWKIMRQHPTLAANLLYPIEFLGEALDIPFSHHEKWDGSGYPQRLKGAEIPLAARIFAVIDVWDALTHDRPYRLAWTESKTLEYIVGQSGKHFDPDVVEQFVALVRSH